MSVIEIREYTLKPASVKEFLSLTAEYFPKRQTLMPIVGMFNTDVGMLNKIVHVYAYTDFDHRDACRKAGANDKEWQQEYLGRSKPCMRAQENAIYIPAIEVLEYAGWKGFEAFQQLPQGAANPIYEIRYYMLATGARGTFLQAMAQGIKARVAIPDAGDLVFVGHCDLGQKLRVVIIWRYSSLQARKLARDKANLVDQWTASMEDTTPLVLESSVEIVQPTSFSPMQ